MSDFRTIVSINPSPQSIRLENNVFTIGSCFADAIGGRLKSYKFPSLINPFGTIYNPVSIHKVMNYALRNESPAPDTYLENQQVYANYDFHSSLSSMNKQSLIESIERTTKTAGEFLRHADWIFITYGTAWVYQRKDNDEMVANCHKMPAETFTKTLLSADQITASFAAFYEQLKAINPSIKIILTLSPVRHIKDTFELNSVSKSLLRVSCYQLSAQFKDVDYFPAYEIMLDDLRDYRFYKSDMLHPNEDAEEYIWNNFATRYFDDYTKTFIKQWKSILAALAHRPFHAASAAHQHFLKQTLQKLEALKTTINTEQEIRFVKSQLI